jgi:superfamily I DNA/RNA helicase
MSWYVPFDKLSSKQLEVLNGITARLDNSHWVQGFAGTGKTLVIAHLMERVAALKPQASICFITFTNALADLVRSGLHGSVAGKVDVKTARQFVNDKRQYDYVFLDEVQDIELKELEKIKALSRHLYIAGDGDQRIYDSTASDDEINRTIRPTLWKLLEVFRLTKLLQTVAQAILPRTKLIEGLHAAKTAEVTVRLVEHKDENAEALWVWQEASRRARAGEPSVVLFPTQDAIMKFARSVAFKHKMANLPEPGWHKGRKDYTQFNEHWHDAGVNLMYFGSGHGDLARGETRPYVYLMTFHSSKGLDFRNVFIPGMKDDVFIVGKKRLSSDPELDRRLLFVAVTRSRENLFISYSGGAPSALLSSLPSDLVNKVVLSEPAGPMLDEQEFF